MVNELSAASKRCVPSQRGHQTQHAPKSTTYRSHRMQSQIIQIAKRHKNNLALDDNLIQLGVAAQLSRPQSPPHSPLLPSISGVYDSLLSLAQLPGWLITSARAINQYLMRDELWMIFVWPSCRGFDWCTTASQDSFLYCFS